VHSRPESHWVADSSDNFGCENGGHQIAGKAIQPGQEQCNVEHPAAIVVAVVYRIDNLPEAIKGVDHHTGCCSVEPRLGKG